MSSSYVINGILCEIPHAWGDSVLLLTDIDRNQLTAFCVSRRAIRCRKMLKVSPRIPGYPCALSKSISHNILRIMLYPSAFRLRSARDIAPRHRSGHRLDIARDIASTSLGTASLDCEAWASSRKLAVYHALHPDSPAPRYQEKRGFKRSNVHLMKNLRMNMSLSDSSRHRYIPPPVVSLRIESASE